MFTVLFRVEGLGLRVLDEWVVPTEQRLPHVKVQSKLELFSKDPQLSRTASKNHRPSAPNPFVACRV